MYYIPKKSDKDVVQKQFVPYIFVIVIFSKIKSISSKINNIFYVCYEYKTGNFTVFNRELKIII